MIDVGYRLVGDFGGDGPAVVEDLARQVPGVLIAHFDYVEGVLSLKVARRVFNPERLREILTRPGVGWALGEETEGRKLEAGSETPDAGSEEPKAGSEKPDAGSETPDAGGEEPKAGSEKPDAGSEQELPLE